MVKVRTNTHRAYAIQEAAITSYKQSTSHNMEMGGTRCENVQVLSYSLKILTHLHEELKLLSI